MTGQLVQLDPKTVIADDNIRIGLKPARIQRLADQIVEAGGVNTPVEVAPIKGAKKGQPQYRLTFGFYRHAAVSQLREAGADITLPALVVESEGVDRLKRQVSENLDRENLSPIDTAVAIKKLLDAGVSRTDIAVLFARPGGKKGEFAPASQSWINVTLSFLDLPKAVQNKIHEGLVPWSAAYELTKVAPERREEILAKAEARRLASEEAEARADEKLAKAQASSGSGRAEKLAAKQAEAEQAVTEAEQAEIAAKEALEAANEALKQAKQVPANFLDLPEAESKAIAERIGAAKADVRSAEASVKAANKAKMKAVAVVEKLEAKATEKPKPAPKPAKAKATVTAKDVARTAKQEGAAVKASKKETALSQKEAAAAALRLAKSINPWVRLVGDVIGRMLAGELPVNAAAKELEAGAPKGKK